MIKKRLYSNLVNQGGYRFEGHRGELRSSLKNCNSSGEVGSSDPSFMASLRGEGVGGGGVENNGLRYDSTKGYIYVEQV